jgi:hypothetical protein
MSTSMPDVHNRAPFPLPCTYSMCICPFACLFQSPSPVSISMYTSMSMSISMYFFISMFLANHFYVFGEPFLCFWRTIYMFLANHYMFFGKPSHVFGEPLYFFGQALYFIGESLYVFDEPLYVFGELFPCQSLCPCPYKNSLS